MSIECHPLTGVLGAEVRGVDLAQVSEVELSQLREAMCRYEVLVVRDQNLNPASQSTFSRRLGDPGEVPFVATMHDHPDVIRVVKEADEGSAFNFGGAWHSDFSFQPDPPAFTVLRAVEVPPYGGDTVFASMSAAWSALPEDMKQNFLGVNAVHTARDAYSRRMQSVHNGMRNMVITCDDVALETQMHPLVTRHPETNKTVFYFNRAYVRDIDGLSENDARELIEFLHAHTTDVRFTYRHRWSQGDVVIWDNRSTQHYALNDYAGFRRELHRTTVAGSAPIAASS
jgi:taurine dioxygenase